MDQIFTALLALGPGGLVAAFAMYLWRDERAERREIQKSYVDLLKEKIESDNLLASSLNKISDLIRVSGRTG